MAHHKHKQKLKFATNVAALLLKKAAQDGYKWTYEMIAEETGLSNATIYRWIHNEMSEVDASTLQIWADFFDCQTGDVLRLPVTQNMTSVKEFA